ncbi:unnamed protein product [Peniophora sp. CBMAI 1063]|nr:unnamed protein product [Peniophora sp. CBMAI 1063]
MAAIFDPSLLSSPPFVVGSHLPAPAPRSNIAYDRAKAIALASGLDLDDICSLKPKFWELHLHPVLQRDGAAMTLLTIQYNLVIGTIGRYAQRQPYLLSLMKDLLKYRVHGQFLLTELGHGLDAKNLETTATLLPSGGFNLSSHTPRAAKFMPPTIPAGAPTIGVVFARLLVDAEDRGIRPFIVTLNDGVHMTPGVTAKAMPPRGGTQIVNHALTSFDNVQLPATAILGSLDEAEDFSGLITRVAVGSLALSLVCVSVISTCATIGFMYSRRRTVTGVTGGQIPIFSFVTQQKPIALAVAQAFVFKALAKWASSFFADATVDLRIRHGVAAASKAVITRRATEACLSISERCGAQGLFGDNQMAALFNDVRMVIVAEGDVLVLCIRLTMELLLGKYRLPPSTHPESALAQHEAALFAELSSILSTASHHRDPEVSRRILPHCQTFVGAIGDRMAYDAALDAGVMPSLLDLYVSDAIQRDGSWYSEQAGLSRSEQSAAVQAALNAVLPQMESLVDDLGVQPYLTAPIVSEKTWARFDSALPTYTSSHSRDGDATDGVEPTVGSRTLSRDRLSTRL